MPPEGRPEADYDCGMPKPDLVMTAEFERALELLHSGENVFVTGKAGTGKSTLVRNFLATTKRKAITVAPTGIAALNVGGYTIHRLFSFRPGDDASRARSNRYRPTRFQKALASLDTLIVDEASMLRADLFDAMAIALERFGPHPGEPFGGVQLVLVGDLYQLPPVVHEDERAYFEEHYGTPFFFSAQYFNRDRFPTVELSTVFRQIGDYQLVSLLNGVRDGALLNEARSLLNQRTNPRFEPPLDEFWLTLTTTNRVAKARNDEMLARLSTQVHHFEATVTGEKDAFEFPAEQSLDVAVGAQVMLLSNDPADRWVNGTLGRIEHITRDESVTVLTRDGDLVEVEPHEWQITRPVVEDGRVRHETMGSFTQLPLKLAWAITIHKSQGQTLDRVVVDLSGGTFANGQLYVALSRCTSLEGLVLKRDVLPRDLKTDNRVRRYLESSKRHGSARGEVYLSALMVGNEGDRYRPRPVEIAAVTEDGQELSTLINPTCDLYNAKADYGIAVRDIQFAPVLAEAWAALAPVLSGRVPVGLDIDNLIGQIDAELKRNGVVVEMPVGKELSTLDLHLDLRRALTRGSALDRARAIRDAAAGISREEGQADEWATAFPEAPGGPGLLLARPPLHADPGVTARMTLVGLKIGSPEADALLQTLWGRILGPDREAFETAQALREKFGARPAQEPKDDGSLFGPPQAQDVLVPGARVCFTGTVMNDDGRLMFREELESLAVKHGLVVTQTVTKTKMDVLVVAERGTQSGKAKKAAQYDKPIIAAEEFLEWCEAN